MDPIALHLEARNVLSLSDELARHEHALGNDDLAGHLASLRSTFGAIERELGRTYDWMAPNPVAVESAERSCSLLRDRTDEVSPRLRPRFGQLLSSLERFVFAATRPTVPVPSKPLGTILPLRRVVPQPVHSVVDAFAATAWLLSAKLARTRRAEALGLLLGAGAGAVSLATDTQLSAVRLLPIETHETADLVTALVGIASPIVLGYVRRDPIASAIQIAAGCGLLLASLFTDYRARRGIGRPLRSRPT